MVEDDGPESLEPRQLAQAPVQLEDSLYMPNQDLGGSFKITPKPLRGVDQGPLSKSFVQTSKTSQNAYGYPRQGGQRDSNLKQRKTVVADYDQESLRESVRRQAIEQIKAQTRNSVKNPYITKE